MAKTTTIAGNTFLFTGKLTEFTREDAEAHVEAEGGKILSGVSAKLNYLVVGEDAGGKLAKAEALGTVTILHEKEFLKMMSKKDSLKTDKVSSKKDTKSVTNGLEIDQVQIGKQIWMTKNLNITSFRNGDPIPQVKSDKDWAKAGEDKKPAWCYLENKKSNGDLYGILYNFYAINDSRGIAPEGFHIPSSAEWTKLIKCFGDRKTAGKKIKASTEKGTNNFNFNGIIGGKRGFMGFFDEISNWWTSTPNLNGIESAISIEIGREDDDIEIGGSSMSSGNYLRCIKD